MTSLRPFVPLALLGLLALASPALAGPDEPALAGPPCFYVALDPPEVTLTECPDLRLAARDLSPDAPRP